MAREIRFDLVIDGVGESIKDFDRLNNEIDQTESNLNSIGSNKDLNKLGAGFDKAAKGFTTAAKGISGAVNLAAGSIGLLGVESAKVQETLLKVQSALALTTGLKDFSEFLSESSIATKAASVAQAAYATVVGTSTGAMKLFKLALVATGIGAFVVLLGLLIANWDKVVEVVNDSIESFEGLGVAGQVLVGILTLGIYPAIILVKKALEDLGLIESKQEKENKKIYAERSKRLEDERKAQDELNAKKLSDIDKEIARNESLGKSVDALNIKRKEEEIAIGAKALAEAELYLALQTRYGFVTKADREFVEGIRKSQEDLEFDLEILNNKKLTADKQNNAKIAQDNKEKNEKIAEDNKKAADDDKQRQDEYFRRINKQTEYEINSKKKAADDLKKLTDEERLVQNREDLAAIEIRLLNVEKGSAEELDILQEKLLLQSDIQLQNEKLTVSEKELINQKYFADLAALDEEYRKKEKLNLEKSVKDRIESTTTTILALGSAIGSIEGPLSGIGDIFAGIAQNVGNFQNSISSAITAFNTEGATEFETMTNRVNAVSASIVAGLEIFGQAIDMIAQSSAEKSDERIGRIENETAVQSRELDAQFKKGLITEEQLAKGQIQIENKKNALIEKEKKKEFEKQKKLRIASATIDMIQGAVAAFAGAFQLGPIAGPIVGSILAASVLAFGAVNISKIAKQKYEGGGAGGGGESATIPSIPSPSTGDVAPTIVDALRGGDSARTSLFGVNTGAVGGASNIEGLGQPAGGGGTSGPQRVYVVESDISSVQNRVNVIQADSTIG